MLNRLATLATACMLAPLGTAALASAEPPPPDPAVQPVANPGPPPDTGAVPSEAPGIAHTPDGRTLTVAARDETQLPIPPLTTALSSRDWLVGATFTGDVTGSVSGGTLEVGYQIGCGVQLDRGMKLTGSLNVAVGSAFGAAGLVTNPGLSFPMVGSIEVFPRPGEILTIPVNKKTFKGTQTRVTVKDIHIKVDGCVGASILRSYAVLTSSSTDTDDIVGYYGVAKVF